MDEMKILVIGNTGQLGWELERTLQPLGEVVSVDYPEINLENPGSIRSWVQQVNPQMIVNAAAYTAVDRAEVEPQTANLINSVAPGLLAEEACACGATLIHFSTDYVFDGQKKEPYQESDRANPINVYGRSKLAGEEAVQAVDGEYFIFRTSWLYSLRRDGFVTRVLHWARTQEEVRIAADQTGSPTWSRSLAETTAQALAVIRKSGRSWRKENSGIYHLAGIGSVNRFDWAEKILELDPRRQDQICGRIVKADSSEFNSAASRPQYSALDCTLFMETFDLHLPDWLAALELALIP